MVSGMRAAGSWTHTSHRLVHAQNVDPVLEYQRRPLGRSAKGSGKGWFGKKKSFGDENVYNRTPAEIAERYRPQGASVNVELPNAYYNRK